MSTPRIIAFVFLVIFGGSGSIAFTRWLARRLTSPDRDATPAVGLGFIGLGCGIFLLMWFGFSFAEPPVEFLRALRAGDEAAAYSLLSPELQEELGGPERFARWARPLDPDRWFFVSGCSGHRMGRSDGIGWMEDGERFSVSFHLRREDGEWVIQGMEYWELGWEYWVGRSSGLDCSD